VAHLADPHAMAAAKPGATRTAPPRMPPEFPLRGRYLAYTLFDATGAVYLLLGLLALRLVWALYLAFHALALAAVVFVAVRFFRLFPKAQPPKIGPLRPPPQPVIHAMLYAAWALVSVLMTAILAGGIFR
jgi:fumarate reductase subunit C